MKTILYLLSQPGLKAKERQDILTQILSNREIPLEELVKQLITANLPIRISAMEAFESFTRKTPAEDSQVIWQFASNQLQEKSPAMLREAGRVIANLAHLHYKHAGKILPLLMQMSEHTGTVVRWSAAQALTKLYLAGNNDYWQLEATLEVNVNREDKESIRKIYFTALSKKSVMRNK